MILSKISSNLSFNSYQLQFRCRRSTTNRWFFPLLPPLRTTSKAFSASCNHPSPYPRTNAARNQQEGHKLEEDRPVHCEVDVVSWRERRIRAWISVAADVETVWNVLTDYERLADFIPNLDAAIRLSKTVEVDELDRIECFCLSNSLAVICQTDALIRTECIHMDEIENGVFYCSGRIPCPHPGRIWLEQRGLQRAMYWHIEARVVLDLEEFPDSANGRELHFSMVDGDFKKFEGKWSVKPGLRSSMAILSYEVNVIPTFNFPAIFLERIIGSDLPVNLRALACRAERNSDGNQKMPTAGSVSYATSSTDLSDAFTKANNLPPNELKNSYISSNFGPLLTPSSSELTSKWGVFGKVCTLDRPCMVDEVHLRRFDGLLENGGVHRCVVASITVKAPVREVWNVLTAYETLPEIVPNLAISKILSRENNKVRILQEGCKGLLYMVLHARVILDLCEHLEHEITFEQVEGDFDSFRGKWLLEQLGSHHTLLKYSVESKIHRDSMLSEAIVEEVVYEDLPSNLCAIRDYLEKQEPIGSNSVMTFDHVKYPDKQTTFDNYVNVEWRKPSVSSDSYMDLNQSKKLELSNNVDSPKLPQQRPKVPGLQRDIEVLKTELLRFISKYGQEGFMPMRKQLRLHGRVDIEKAITHRGGFRKIASLMNLSLAYKHRKPKGYWDNLENLGDEISRFQRSWGMDPEYMPSRKSFERAGRYDIARALEKWGGLHEVARLLSLKVRYPSRQANPAAREKTDDAKRSEDQEKLSKNRYVSQDTQEWLMELELKHLDVNWME
ncbi:hypothetical protein ACLOJK_033147 [Asimina triloba]